MKLALQFRSIFQPILLEYCSALEKTNTLGSICAKILRGGKAKRPFLTWCTASSFQNPWPVDKAMLAMEAFHTASLIADDLPCMDNDCERRGQPSCHILFGESNALLASYSLLAEAHALLAQNSQNLHRYCTMEEAFQRTQQLWNLAAQCSGLIGACEGQYLDISVTTTTVETLLQMFHLKTGTFFYAAIASGWLLGGGSLALFHHLKPLAYAMGEAFQIADDFHDLEQDKKENMEKNLVLKVGQNEAYQLWHSAIEQAHTLLDKLGLPTDAPIKQFILLLPQPPHP